MPDELRTNAERFRPYGVSGFRAMVNVGCSRVTKSYVQYDEFAGT